MSPLLSASSFQRERLVSRLVRHHLPLLGITLASIAALYSTRPYKDVISRASFATAYPAIVLLAATLLIGPLNLLRRKRNPVSSDLRRDLGIWAGILGMVHTAVGQCVHLRGRPWLYYVYGPAEHHHSFPLRHDLFGFANYTGAVSVLVLFLLFVTSNDYSLRRLGTSRWKQLQRWNYVVCGLAWMHAFGYQGIEKQRVWWVAAIIACAAVAVAVQVAGVIKTRSVALSPLKG